MDQVWTRLINLQNNLINIYIACIFHECGIDIFKYGYSVKITLWLIDNLCTCGIGK